MSIRDQISVDLKAAMKEQMKQKVSVLRMLLSEIKYAEASGDASQSLADAEVLKVISTYHKRLSKSLSDFPEGEKTKAIESEMQIVEQYLPQKASRDEVEKAADELISTSEEKNFGILMKGLMAKFGNSADGKMISEVLKQKLS